MQNQNYIYKLLYVVLRKANDKFNRRITFSHRIHECKQMTRDFGDKAANWIGRYLGNDKLRLVYYMENTERRTIETDKLIREGNPNISPEDKVCMSL